jgi:hypothetical protein
MFIGDHQVVFEGCFKNTNESRSLFLASRLTQLLRPRTKGKLHCLGGHIHVVLGIHQCPRDILWHLIFLK